MREGRRIRVTIATLALAAAAQAAPASAQETADPRAPLEAYIRGHATGDGTHMLDAFHSGAEIEWIADGEVRTLTREEFADRFRGTPAPDEAERVRRIESVDVTGDAGVAKIVLDYPRITYTDYMSLLRTPDGWKIVHKGFHAEPKPGS